MDKVQESVEKAKSMLNGIMKDYVKWIVTNPSRASDMESSVKLISYLLHGRLKSASTILPELIYCSANVLAFWHDTLIRNNVQKKLSTGTRENGLVNGSDGPSASAELISNQMKVRNSQIHRIKSSLTVLEYLEVFLEVSAKQLWGDFGRWVVILLVQAVKTGFRAALLFYYKVGLIESSSAHHHQRSKVRSARNPSSSPSNLIFVLKHSGRVVRKIHAAPPLVSRDWSVPSSPDIPTVPQELTSTQMLAEVIHLMRPLTHLASLGCWGKLSWKPWILSAAMDLTSLHIHGNYGRLRKEEKVELTRRTYALCYYLLRSPFYDKYTKMRLHNVLMFLADRVPIFGSLCGVLAASIPEWQNTYSYMWTDY